MSRLRTLLTMPAAAATAALMMSAVPATAAPVTAAPTPAAVGITPSPLVGIYLEGGCPKTTDDLARIVAKQRINWAWAPIALDGPEGAPLAKVLIPNTINPDHPSIRQRHDLLEGQPLTAPGPKPQNPITCEFKGEFEEREFNVIITGVVVTIPKWLDALQPPIKAPVPVPKPE